MADDHSSTGQPTRGWRRHGVNEPPRLLDLGLDDRQVRRRRTLLLLLLGCVTVAGAIVGWFLLPQRFIEPYFLTIPLTEYDEPRLPINPWAMEDSRKLRLHFPHSHQEFNFQEGHILVRAFDTLRTEKRPVVVHLRAYALTHGEQVYLLPGDTKFTELESYWRPLDLVFQALKECPSPERLLVLDLMQPLADPFLGVLVDDTAQKVNAYLEREFKKADAPTLSVLCACGPGQVSLVSEELGLSVFGHYLNEGLHGKADGWGPGRTENSRVSALELAHYVKDQVSHWARHNRGVDQTPVLHGKGRDFDLVSLVGRPVGRTDPPDLNAYPGWLQAGWDARDELWRKQDAHLMAPAAFQQFESALLRSEQRWRGENLAAQPTRLNRAQQYVRQAQQQVVDQLRQVPLPAAAEVSLAWARRLGQQPIPDLHREVQQLVDLRRQLDKAADPKEREKLAQKLSQPRQELLDKCKDKPFPLGEALFMAALQDPVPDVVVFLAKLADDAKLTARYAEIRFLQRFAQALVALRKKREDLFKNVRATEVTLAALLCQQQAEEAAACTPQVLPWIQKAFEEAAKQRQQGLAVFLKESPTRWDQASSLLREAKERFALLIPAHENLAEAYGDLDRALATLPRVMPYLLAPRKPNPRTVRAWDDLVKGIEDLDELMAVPRWQDAAAVASAGGEVRRHYRELRRPMEEDAFKRLQGQAQVEEPTAIVAELEAMRVGPWLTAGLRAGSWQLLRELGRKLNEKSAEAEARRSRAGADGGHADHFDPEQARLRARLMVDLLRIARDPTATELTAEFRKLGGNTDPAAWAAFGEKLRKSWFDQMPRRLQALTAESEGADRIPRLLPLARNEVIGTRPNTAGLRRQQVAAEYWSWLEGVQREDGLGP